MTQAEIFRDKEGNAWLKRNTKSLPIKDDLVLNALSQLVGVLGAAVLEIGCANGWRLEELKKRYGITDLVGIDPSAQAVEEAQKRGIVALRGCAHDTLASAPDSRFDLVIFGFCLYLCDRQDLFRIAYHADRVLTDGGIMVVYDFSTLTPCKRKYKHRDGLWSYKQDYDQMFLWNPAYTKLITVHHRNGLTKATVLKKKLERGWPECE